MKNNGQTWSGPDGGRGAKKTACAAGRGRALRFLTPLAILLAAGVGCGRARDNRVDVVLTFDDGTVDHYENAARVLDRHEVKGTFYIITDLIGSNGYLTAAQLKEMSGHGHEIASHTASQGTLPDLSEEDVHDQCGRSRVFLASNGLFTGSFAYPGHKRTPQTDAVVTQYYSRIRPPVREGTETFKESREKTGAFLSFLQGLSDASPPQGPFYFCFHQITSNGEGAYVVREETLDYFVSQLQQMPHVRIVPAREVHGRQ